MTVEEICRPLIVRRSGEQLTCRWGLERRKSDQGIGKRPRYLRDVDAWHDASSPFERGGEDPFVRSANEADAPTEGCVCAAEDNAPLTTFHDGMLSRGQAFRKLGATGIGRHSRSRDRVDVDRGAVVRLTGGHHEQAP